MQKLHIIDCDTSINLALNQLNMLSIDAILFVIDKNNKLIGSLTDGDLRRGFIKGLDFSNKLTDFVQPNPVYIRLGDKNAIDILDTYRKKNYKVIPILNNENEIVDIVNFRIQSTIVPVDVVLMAGGEGKRLRPLTLNTPKPLLVVGDKPIIEHNIDRLSKFGIKNIYLSVNFLRNQIIEYFKDGSHKGLNIKYVKEDKPMGTVGSVLLVDHFEHDDIIIMNSDLLTNIDYEDFYRSYKLSGSDMAVAATSYNVDVPYAVLEVNEFNEVKSLKEKPRYTYYSNAGIYILKKSLLDLIPKDTFFDITDLMEVVLERNMKLFTYPITGYWLDIGRPEDFKKAQEDIRHLDL
ncbi:MAG: nucleotidyltransferase family protein [Chitinophagales bacterium]|nr:nucleotidyltransferase family protein [Chitinophagales bacterium]